MRYILYGSKTSPFVRRVRMLLEKVPYDFKEIDIFGTDAELLKTINPVNQIPVLIDGDQKIWDSRTIFNYLNLTHRFQNMDWDDENLLTAIDGAMNAGVALILLKRSGLTVDQPLMYLERQKQRIETVLDYLRPFIEGPALSHWNFHTMSIYCFLDWATFRGIIDIAHRPECQALLENFSKKQIVQETQIPRG